VRSPVLSRPNAASETAANYEAGRDHWLHCRRR
jgi:hypothetical protein